MLWNSGLAVPLFNRKSQFVNRKYLPLGLSCLSQLKIFCSFGGEERSHQQHIHLCAQEAFEGLLGRVHNGFILFERSIQQASAVTLPDLVLDAGVHPPSD